MSNTDSSSSEPFLPPSSRRLSKDPNSPLPPQPVGYPAGLAALVGAGDPGDRPSSSSSFSNEAGIGAGGGPIVAGYIPGSGQPLPRPSRQANTSVSSSGAQSYSSGSRLNPPTRPHSAGGLGVAAGMGTNTSTRGSMILYRVAGSASTSAAGSPRLADLASQPGVRDSTLLPPRFSTWRESSYSSSARSSIISFTGEKYPTSSPSSSPSPNQFSPTEMGLTLDPSLPPPGWRERGLVPYAYDPTSDLEAPADEEDLLHDPKVGTGKAGESRWERKAGEGINVRGISNLTLLLLLLLSLIALFVVYPAVDFTLNGPSRHMVTENPRVNATGQAPVLFQLPELIDPDTPESAKVKRSWGINGQGGNNGGAGEEWELVFSDEFEKEGRSFYPGDDPFWEAVDIWYGATGDVEWYDPGQVTTRNGKLVITIDSADQTQPGLTKDSTAPFTVPQAHGLTYRSGMLQSWNKVCFSGGYIEVALQMPGSPSSTGYWPGVWTMGNLGRPGYGGTTDGMWPYSYDTCDLGTFPNQTLPARLGGPAPPEAVFTEASRSKYNMELSWLPGQRMSACTCPITSQDPIHPGPGPSAYTSMTSDTTLNPNGFTPTFRGRGAPEIDVLEAQHNKAEDFRAGLGGIVSQSCQVAPFSTDYLINNSTEAHHRTWNSPTSTPALSDLEALTHVNTFHGSAIQQSISSLSHVPDDAFQIPGAEQPGVLQGGPGTESRGRMSQFGFEYIPDPDPAKSYVLWQVDGKPTHRMTGLAVGPDTTVRVGQRIVPVEPMSIVLNLGMSPNWQDILLETMTFPGEMLIDYVRVYQPRGRDGITFGCDPPEYPTKAYIDRYKDVYENPNLTAWPYEKPKNALYEGGC